MFQEILLIGLSLLLLYLGAGWLVGGASALAIRLGITPLVIGLTVVALGTSTPELIVSVQAAAKGNGSIAIGNVVGSNIFNISVILGISALCYPISIKAIIIRRDIPVMLATAGLFLLLFLNNAISRWEGILLLVASAAYTVYNVMQSKKEMNQEVVAEFQQNMPAKMRPWWQDLLLLGFGLAVLLLGSDLLVNNAVQLARYLGMSDAVIGLTIVAAGTSMPELATSVVAALRKESDIAIGNVVGSNIYNILVILGLSSLITPIQATDISLLDTLLMLGLSLLLLPLVRTGFVLNRWEGSLLLLVYAVYLYLLLPTV